MPDVTQILSQQHREVEALFERFEQSTSAAQRGDIAREIVANLSRHSAVEEMTVYPEIARAVGDDVADSLRHEHHELKEVLASVEQLDPSDDEFARQVREAQRLVEEHVEEEESEVFARFRQEVPSSTLESLGEKIESQWSTAPTHPHPNAPDRPPANKVTGPAAGAADKVRDAISGQ